MVAFYSSVVDTTEAIMDKGGTNSCLHTVGTPNLDLVSPIISTKRRGSMEPTWDVQVINLMSKKHDTLQFVLDEKYTSLTPMPSNAANDTSTNTVLVAIPSVAQFGANLGFDPGLLSHLFIKTKSSPCTVEYVPRTNMGSLLYMDSLQLGRGDVTAVLSTILGASPPSAPAVAIKVPWCSNVAGTTCAPTIGHSRKTAQIFASMSVVNDDSVQSFSRNSSATYPRTTIVGPLKDAMTFVILPVDSCVIGSSGWPPPTDNISDGGRGVFVALHSPSVCSEFEVSNSSAENLASQTVYARPSRWPPPAQMSFFVKCTVNSQRIQRSLDDVLTLNAEVIEKVNHTYLSAAAIPIVTCYLFYGSVVVPTHGNYVVMCVNAATICVNPGICHTLFCGLIDSLKVFSRAPTCMTFVFSVKLFSCGPITSFYCCWLPIEIILPICGIITVHFTVSFDSGLGHTTPSSFQTGLKRISCPYYLYCLRVWHHYCAHYEEFRALNWIFPYVMVLRTVLVPQDYSLECSFYILVLDNSIISKLCLSCSPSGYISIPQGLAAYMTHPRPPILSGVVARIHKALLAHSYTEDANHILLEDLIRKDDSKTQVFMALIPKGTFINVSLCMGLHVVKVRLMVVHEYKLISPDVMLVPEVDFAHSSVISGYVHDIQDKGGTSSCLISAAFSINAHLMLHVTSVLSIALRHILGLHITRSVGAKEQFIAAPEPARLWKRLMRPMASVLHISGTRNFISRHTYATIETTKYYFFVITALGTSQFNSTSTLQDGEETVCKILILWALLQFLLDCHKRLQASLIAGGVEQQWGSKTNASLLCYAIGPLRVILPARSIADTGPFHSLCCCCYVPYAVLCSMLHWGVLYVLLALTLYVSMYEVASHHSQEGTLLPIVVYYYTSFQLTSVSNCYIHGQLMLLSRSSQFIMQRLWGITPKDARVDISLYDVVVAHLPYFLPPMVSQEFDILVWVTPVIAVVPSFSINDLVLSVSNFSKDEQAWHWSQQQLSQQLVLLYLGSLRGFNPRLLAEAIVLGYTHSDWYILLGVCTIASHSTTFSPAILYSQ